MRSLSVVERHCQLVFEREETKGLPGADKDTRAKHELWPGRPKVFLRGPSLLPWAVVCLASALPWERPPPLIRWPAGPSDQRGCLIEQGCYERAVVLSI
jgi:hypothetical protein